MTERILVVAHQYWPTPGSATQRLSALVAQLRERRAEVDVITCEPRQGAADGHVGPSGERVWFASGPEGTGSGLRRVVTLFAFVIGVLRRGSRVSYDVVITDPPPSAALAAWILARRRSAHFVYYMCDSWGGATRDSTAALPTIAHPFVKGLEDWLLRSSDLVMAVTERMRQIAASAGARNVELLENGVPLEVFMPDGAEWRPQSLRPRPFFLYAGNAGVVHGADVFARAAEELWTSGREFDLVFMGHGADLPLIREIQRRWPDRLYTEPTRSPEVVAAAYRGALGALSSLRPFDSYADARPIKSLTGLAAGCPPIYAGEGAFAELLQREHLGFVREWSLEGAKDSMLRAMELFQREPADYAVMRDRCANFARTHLDNRLIANRAANLVISRGEISAAQGI